MTMPNLSEDEAERRRLGEKLRQAREYLGFSQDEVATFLKVPRTAITHIEGGQRRVEALDELKRLARVEVGFSTNKWANILPDRELDVSKNLCEAP